MFGSTAPGWPEASPTLLLPDHSHVRLRPLRRADGKDCTRMRTVDEQWLRPVEPTVEGSWKDAHSLAAWRKNWSQLRAMAVQGIVVPLAIELDGSFVGQVTLGNIQHGAVSECWIGYWVHSAFMGRGIATAACGLGTDHALTRVGLHRVTATFLPDNPASGRVLAANGYRKEGYLRRNLHIDGKWRDHHLVAINREDFSTTAVNRLIDAGKVRPLRRGSTG
ncbi:GNAT family N-acetyltransferase [Corynebacterium mayonis]|uniref:GNAT family N-acetyltransferase n=1 Tax=Corynebacterium mayonis TaxID=3062461 RepID=UPI003140C628